MTAAPHRTDHARQVDQIDGATVLLARDGGDWEAWLGANHHDPAGAWLMIAKKNTGVTTLTHREALDGALCYGWIDSLRRSLDAIYYLQKYSRRRRGSAWSTINADRADALVAANRMRAAGLVEVERAKAADRFGPDRIAFAAATAVAVR